MKDYKDLMDKLPDDLKIDFEIFLKGEFIAWGFCFPFCRPNPDNDELFFYAPRHRSDGGLHPMEFLKLFKERALSSANVPAGSFYRDWLDICPLMEKHSMKSGKLTVWDVKPKLMPAFEKILEVVFFCAAAIDDAGKGAWIAYPGGWMRPVALEDMNDEELHIVHNEASEMAYANSNEEALQTIEIYDNLKSQINDLG